MSTVRTDDVAAEMRQFVEDNFAYMRPDLEIGPDDDLLELGLVDSLAFVELVEEVQARYGVEVKDVEITQANFGSVGAIADFVAARRGR